jgi:NADPH-dependent 2,4-dienoyl-CoA reductase/sulfur reductase-like enzyme
MRKDKENIWFWFVAISIMVLAMCVLSLQIIELHQQNNSERMLAQHKELPVTVPEEPVVAVEEKRVLRSRERLKFQLINVPAPCRPEQCVRPN